MTTITESDLQELKLLINGRFDELKGRLDHLEEQLGTIDKKLDVYIAKNDEKLNAIQSNLDDLKKQTEKQDNRLWILVSSLSFALLGALAKTVFFPNP